MASRIKNFSIMGVHWKIRFLRGEREGVGGGGGGARKNKIKKGDYKKVCVLRVRVG